MNVEEWSSGYYMVETVVEPHVASEPYINHQDYQDLQFELYDSPDQHSERVIFQMDEYTFEVLPSRGVPTSVLALPEDILEETRVKNPPSRRPVRVPKPWAMDYVLFDAEEWEEPPDFH